VNLQEAIASSVLSASVLNDMISRLEIRLTCALLLTLRITSGSPDLEAASIALR
jgi:hypothetical protein